MPIKDSTQAILATVVNEGGWVCDPNDPGGETAHGITKPNWPQWDGWAKVDAAKAKAGVVANKATPAQVKQINEVLWADMDYRYAVIQFYKTNFWDKIRGDELHDLDMAHSIFDFAVNAGVATSLKVAKVALHMDVVDASASDDYVNDANASNAHYFLDRFTLGKIARYVSICEKRPTSKAYFFGWVRRALKENN